MPENQVTNPLNRITIYYRTALYILTTISGAIVAGFSALGDLPDWVVAMSAVVAFLAGGTALSHLSPDKPKADK